MIRIKRIPQDFWLRTWEADWVGCRHKPHAYTANSVYRKAERIRRFQMRDY